MLTGYLLITRARHGRGAKVKPGMGSSDGCSSKSASFRGDSKRKCCIIEAKKRKSEVLAKVSPMQLLFPNFHISQTNKWNKKCRMRFRKSYQGQRLIIFLIWQICQSHLNASLVEMYLVLAKLEGRYLSTKDWWTPRSPKIIYLLNEQKWDFEFIHWTETLGMWYPWHSVFCCATCGTVRGATTPNLWISWSVASVKGNLQFTNIGTNDLQWHQFLLKTTFPCLLEKEVYPEGLHRSLLAPCFEYVDELSWKVGRSRGCGLSSLNRLQKYRKWYPTTLPLQEIIRIKSNPFDYTKSNSDFLPWNRWYDKLFDDSFSTRISK